MPIPSAMAAFVLSRDPSHCPIQETKPVAVRSNEPTTPTLFVIPKAEERAKPLTPQPGEQQGKSGGSGDGIPDILIGPLRQAMTIVPRPKEVPIPIRKPVPLAPTKIVGSTRKWVLRDRFGVDWVGDDKDNVERWVAQRNSYATYQYPGYQSACPGGRCPR